MTLAQAIDDSLRLTERHASAAQVHTVVGNALKTAAPDLTIKTTDYFTHSFVPDLVLGWGSNGERATRHVHLRFRIGDMSFLDDVDLVASTEPIFGSSGIAVGR